MQHLYNPSLTSTRITSHQIFQETTLQVIKAKEVSTSLLLVGGPLEFRWNLNVNVAFRLASTKIWCPMLKHIGCMVHTLEQYWKQFVCNYKQLFIAIAMVCHKKELTGEGVSRELSIGKEKKHKRTDALVSGCKCCMKLWW